MYGERPLRAGDAGRCDPAEAGRLGRCDPAEAGRIAPPRGVGTVRRSPRYAGEGTSRRRTLPADMGLGVAREEGEFGRDGRSDARWR